MCGGGSTPSAPEPLPQAPQLPQSPQSPTSAGAAVRKKVAAKRGANFGDTLVTGSRGLTQPAQTTTKTLLSGS